MLRDEIIESMARALFVTAWSYSESEAGRSHGGEELMDVAPRTSKRAEQAAKKLAAAMEKTNGIPLEALYILAALQPGKRYGKDEPSPHLFGHYMAMQALGTGVSWWDDFPRITEVPEGVEHFGRDGIAIPNIEFFY